MRYILGHRAVKPGWYVVTVGGELDMNAAPSLGLAVDKAFQQRATTLVVDLGEITSIDSAAVDILMSARERLLGSGGRFEVVCTAPSVVRVLEIAGVETVERPP
jgi:anti-sigma B factor antagonist